jgi:hypothetical protein
MAHRLRAYLPCALDTGWLQAVNTSAQIDPQLQQAWLLVGRFLYHFARIEQKIDQAVIKLLNLDEKTAPIVASIDFVKKLDDLVRASAYKELKDAKKEREFAKTVCNRVHDVNRHRRIIAHASFEPAPGGGVLFSRPVTEKGSVRPVTEPWTDENFATLYAEMTALEADLDKLIQLIKPADVPNFGWYVPWTDMMYRGTPLPLRAAASNALVDVPWFPGKDDTIPPR